VDVSPSMSMFISSSAGVKTVDGTATDGPRGGLLISFSSSSDESAGVRVGVFGPGREEFCCCAKRLLDPLTDGVRKTSFRCFWQ